MSRWVPILLAACLCPFGAFAGAQEQKSPPDQLKKERPKEATSDKEEVPPEEDASLAKEDYPFNPLQSKNDVGIGDEYAKKHNYHAAAARYRSATRYDDSNLQAWLKLGEAEEKLKDTDAAKQAYTKYLELATDSKEAKTVTEIRKKMEKLK
jgi:tetratricopeptide (TPR) repeat protein